MQENKRPSKTKLILSDFKNQIVFSLGMAYLHSYNNVNASC